MENTILVQDQFYLFTTGEYDCYKVRKLVKALKTFDIKNVLQFYLEKFPIQKEKHHFEEYEFLYFLFKKELIEEISVEECHYSSYSTPDIYLEKI